MNRRSRPLYRDSNDKMIGGVCSGLGHYFDIDTLLVRVAFVVVAVLAGGGILAYVLLWAILEPAPPGALDTASEPVPPAIEDTVDAEASLEDQAQNAVDAPPSEEPRTDER